MLQDARIYFFCIFHDISLDTSLHRCVFPQYKHLNCVSANPCVYLCAFVCESVSVMQSEHLAPLCSTTLAQTRESVDYWMQLQRVGQTIKIDSAFAFYHTPNTAEVKACEPWAASILIMIENMQPLNWEAYLYFFFKTYA